MFFIVKKKKKNGVLPLGDFYTMGLNSSLSSPNSELRAGLEKGGGGEPGRFWWFNPG